MLSGCTQNQSKEAVLDRVKGIVPISYDDLIEKIDQQHDFILYIGRADCQDCLEFYPQLESFLENHSDLGLYYLDVKAFRDAAKKEDASQEEIDFFDGIYETLDFDWTPTLQHRVGQKLVDQITYLDMDFYSIEDEKQKQEAKQASLEAIWQWLENQP